MKSYSSIDDNPAEPKIIVLVGPSGSGKTKVAQKLLERIPRMEKLVSYTTKDPTSLKENSWYNYVTKERFYQMLDNGELFESTMYAGHGFGSKREDVEKILADGKIVLAAMDICGAMSLKTNFDNVATVYIKRDKRTLLTSILEKNSTVEDKVNRIISIDDERNNEDICDHVILNTGYDETAESIIKLLNL